MVAGGLFRHVDQFSGLFESSCFKLSANVNFKWSKILRTCQIRSERGNGQFHFKGSCLKSCQFKNHFFTKIFSDSVIFLINKFPDVASEMVTGKNK